MLKTGTVIDGKYKILNEIGHGGMSTVYLAINEKANKSWAVKEIRRKNNRHFETLRQSMIVETNLLKRLSHPNLPRIVDIIDNDEDFLIVMDYIDGNTLERLIEDEGAQPQNKVADWALQLCDVLGYLHSQAVPVIYRDMKPSNIMLKADGSIMLIDFGTAREYKDTGGADTAYLGTRGYAAPEQFGGMGQTDARTDIYCLGATMYHLLTAHNPSEPPYEMYPITKWKPELSDGLEKIILKCTQKNPDNRYQSIDELAYALKNYTAFETDIQKSFKRKLSIFAALSCAAAACALAAAGFCIAAKLELNAEYRALLEKALNSAGRESVQCGLCMEAVRLAPQRAQAYRIFCDAAAYDGVFTPAEERILLDINASDGKYLEKFKKNDKKGYADFCYEIGKLYRHYFDEGTGRSSKSNALPWFETAALCYGNDKSYEAEYNKCLAYIESEELAQKAAALQIEGNDEGMYQRYWDSLAKIKALDIQKPENAYVTLDIDRELISCITEYAGYFSGDGVSGEELLGMLDKIENEVENFTADDEMQRVAVLDIKKGLYAARKRVSAFYD